MSQPRIDPIDTGRLSRNLGRVLAIAAALGSVAGPIDAQRPSGAYSNHSYVVEVPGEAALRPMGLSGGDIIGEVLVNPDPGTPTDRYIGRLGVTPLTLRVDPVSLPSWVAATVNDGPAPRNIAVSLVDTAGQAQYRRELSGSVVTGLAFPQLDATSAAQPSAVTLRVMPAEVQYAGGGTSPAQGTKAGQWSGAFRFNLAEFPTNQVVRIAPFAWTRNASATQVDRLGQQRQSGVTTSVENLKLEIALAALPAWQAWVQSFLLGGQRQELNGNLELLSSTGERVLDVLLEGVGIVSLTMPQMENVTAPTFGVELYVERIRLAK